MGANANSVTSGNRRFAAAQHSTMSGAVTRLLSRRLTLSSALQSHLSIYEIRLVSSDGSKWWCQCSG